jgi:hypothetical protein
MVIFLFLFFIKKKVYDRCDIKVKLILSILYFKLFVNFKEKKVCIRLSGCSEDRQHTYIYVCSRIHLKLCCNFQA